MSTRRVLQFYLAFVVLFAGAIGFAVGQDRYEAYTQQRDNLDAAQQVWRDGHTWHDDNRLHQRLQVVRLGLFLGVFVSATACAVVSGIRATTSRWYWLACAAFVVFVSLMALSYVIAGAVGGGGGIG